MRRGKMDIIIDILETLKKKELAKTAIVYHANLNFRRADRYLDMMVKMELVDKSSDKYILTTRGRECLQKINDLKSIINIREVGMTSFTEEDSIAIRHI
jgi:predicted transcriptional regulator